MSKMFFLTKMAGAHCQYVCNNSAKFQIDCLKTVEGVDYKTYLVLVICQKFSKYENVAILSKILPYQKDRCTSSICLQQLSKVSD